MHESNKNKGDISAVIDHVKELWNWEEVKDSYVENSNNISASGLSSGDWSGSFSFWCGLVESEVTTPPEEVDRGNLKLFIVDNDLQENHIGNTDDNGYITIEVQNSDGTTYTGEVDWSEQSNDYFVVKDLYANPGVMYISGDSYKSGQVISKSCIAGGKSLSIDLVKATIDINDMHNQFDYKVNGNKIDLDEYTAIDANVEIYDYYIVDGKLLRAALTGVAGFGANTSSQDGLESVVLGSNIIYEPMALNEAFYGCSSLVSIDFGLNPDTSKCTNMYGTFYDCMALENINGIEKFNTSNVTTMEECFYNCYNLPKLNLNAWDTSSVKSFYQMFYEMDSISELIISDWNTSSVTNMAEMFIGCDMLTELDLFMWDTTIVEDCSFMFSDCPNLKDISLGGYCTFEACMDMTSMFDGCSSIIGIDLSDFDTRNVLNADSMFMNCSKLSDIEFGAYGNFENCKNMDNMFNRCSSLRELDLTRFSTNSCSSMNFMFEGTTNMNRVLVSNRWVLQTDCTTTNMFLNSGVSNVTVVSN